MRIMHNFFCYSLSFVLFWFNFDVFWADGNSRFLVCEQLKMGERKKLKEKKNTVCFLRERQEI